MQKHRQVHRVKDEEEHLLLRLVNKAGAVKERRVARWTMNGADDLNKILIRFLAPRDVENTALLTWEAKDGNDDQWLYLPATRNAKRIAATGKKNRFMGTDFTYEDLRPENMAVHTYTLDGIRGGRRAGLLGDRVGAGERAAGGGHRPTASAACGSARTPTRWSSGSTTTSRAGWRRSRRCASTSTWPARRGGPTSSRCRTSRTGPRPSWSSSAAPSTAA